MAAPNVKNLFAQANSNGVTAATVFTHGTGLKNPDGTSGYGGILNRIVLYNPDTIGHIVLLYRIPSAGTAGATNLIERRVLGPGAVDVVDGPYYSLDSAFYQVQLGEAISASQVSVQAYYNELS